MGEKKIIITLTILKIHKDLKSNNSFGIHWATFQLTREKWDDPPRDLFLATKNAGLKPDEFFILKIGETWEKTKNNERQKTD